MSEKCCVQAEVHGIVQGVGFRPFLLRSARQLRLSGFVRNTPKGVTVTVAGGKGDVNAFITRMQQNPPPLAKITQIHITELPYYDYGDFTVTQSDGGEAETFVCPDMGICEACKKEIMTAGERRQHYAFTNCTECGPRFSIIRALPYDRPATVMADFPMCDDCRREYENPADRRFHAEPIACPVCGPQLRFLSECGEGEEPFAAAVRRLAAGEIIAVKGLGGFHLACDACNERAVAELRKRKVRYEKPFAVMVRDMASAERLCETDETERALLNSAEKPIVLLRKKKDIDIAPSVAPHNTRLGVMLPYTPLHCLLMQHFEALVMTSGNAGDEPMLFAEGAEARLLNGLADGVLTHNRPIERRVDDSVCIVINAKPRFIRRARGFAPEPLPLPGQGGVLFAAGAGQKNTFCLAKNGFAFVSSHMGDLQNAEAEADYRREVDSFERLFDAIPVAAVCDGHPDYFATRYAESLDLPLTYVQHHRAHFASVLAEHNEYGTHVLGVIFDGTGLGDDRTVWGGELFYGGIARSEHIGGLLPFRLAGNEAAVREPWRVAAYLINEVEPGALSRLLPDYAPKAPMLLQACKAGLNAPVTSSMGRLFDGVAAIAGVLSVAHYEGQGAVMWEQAADMTAEGAYEFALLSVKNTLLLDWRPVVKALIEDILNGVPMGTLSARFHRGVIRLILQVAQWAKDRYGVQKIALSGGCFQNAVLTAGAEQALTAAGYTVFANERLPANDGNIAFGQVAAVLMQNKNVLQSGDCR